MQEPIISGIQQMGVGIPDVYEAWAWYRKYFGVDIPILDAAGEAELMLPYTSGKPCSRHAVLAINLQGGGGMEIWQLKSREPVRANFEIQIGDLGIFAAKVKTRDVKKAYDFFEKEGLNLVSEIVEAPNGTAHFFLKDPYGNLFQIVPSDDWFHLNGHLMGGIYGAILGVSDIDKASDFYKKILGYDQPVYHQAGAFEDLKMLPGGQSNLKRLCITHSQERMGAFGKMLGSSELELVEVTDRSPKKIFENRDWGDQGFIHLSFDIRGMEELKKICEAAGHPFTIDSSDSFDMGEAAGHFSYIEDPDGTLIEFVETHKIPILKKFNWNLDLRKRAPEKHLPKWMLKALGFSRVKD